MNTYSDDEVLSMINVIFELEIKKKELIEGKPDIVRKIFSMFLRDFGYAVEKFKQIPFSAPNDVHQYPQMYQSIIFDIALTKCVGHFLRMVYDNSDFQLMDTISPKWSRTKNFIVLFIEFYNFVSDYLPKYQEEDEKIEEKKQFNDEFKIKIKEYKEKIRKKHLENAEAEIELEKVSESLHLVSEKIEEGQENKNRLKGRLEGLKEEIKEIGMKVKETELAILECQEKVTSLKTQVIDENESLEIEEGKKKLVALQESNEQLKTTLKDVNRNLKLLKELEEIISNEWIPSLNGCQEEFNKKCDFEVKFEEVKKGISSLMKTYKDLDMTLQAFNENVKGQEEERNQLAQRKEFNVTGLKNELSQLKLTVEDIRRNTDEQDIVAQDLQSEIEKKTRAIKELNQRHEHRLALGKTEIEKLRAAIREMAKTDLNKLRKAKEEIMSL